MLSRWVIPWCLHGHPEDSVPSFRKGHGEGWVTEYAMCAPLQETVCQGIEGPINARNLEIQRLIGRSLRGVVDFAAMESGPSGWIAM